MYYKGKHEGWIKHIDFVVLDVLVLELSYFLSYCIRFGIGKGEDPSLYFQAGLALVVFSLIEATFTNNYKNILKRGLYDEFKATIKHILFMMAALLLYLFLLQDSTGYSRIVYILTFVMAVVFTFMARQLWKVWIKEVFSKFSKGRRSLVAVTTFAEAQEFVESLKKNIDTMYKLRGVVVIDKDMSGQEISGVEVVSDRDDVLEYLCRDWVDEVFVSLPEGETEFANKIINECVVMGVTVHKRLAKKAETPGCMQLVQKMGDYTVLSSSVNMVNVIQMAVKRVIDIVGSIVGLIFTGILFIFVAPAIYIKSPGPIFFKQWRVGRNGKKFQIYKFRSMYMDAEARKAELMAQNKIKDGMMFKIENDPRIIGGENGKGIGNFIRNTSIDEFPQFLNVLKGDMSLVGTRPPTVDEWEKYKYHHRKRMAIKPGLTGMWQVSGRSDIVDFEEVVRLDTEYITSWSLGKDIVIMIKTVLVVLFGKGSY